MATQEQFPDSDKDGTTKAQIPHSGVRGYEQPPTRQFDNTSLSEAVQQGLIETPTSPAPLMPPVEVEKTQRSWKKPAAVGALVLATAAGAFGIGKSSGNDSGNESRVETSVSASANTGEQSPASSPDLPGANDVEMLDPAGTADEVQGNFRALLSKVINARADQGGVISDNTDLQYISSGPNLSEFDQFVKDKTAEVIAARKYEEEHGYSGQLNLSIMTEIQSSRQTPTGGFTIKATTEYEAVDENNQLIGAVSGNSDAYTYRYDYVTFTLPDGTQKETFALVGFTKIPEYPN